MVNLDDICTEQRNHKTTTLDQMSIREALQVMIEEDALITEAIRTEIPYIEATIAAVIDAFNNGGRLIYIGAGTSGRLGLLDAVECPPTFGTPPDMVIGLLAGGGHAFERAIEDIEDNEEEGVNDLKKIKLQAKDIVIGLAASGRTPYVISALQYANSVGCKTAAISCNKNTPLGKIVDFPIEVCVGPEVLTGSTRLKAGTAQKIILNMISTLSMVGIGKVYENLMVDLQLTNQKLRVRAENMIMKATGVDRETASRVLKQADGSVKLAIVMILLNCSVEKAQQRLSQVGGHVRKAISINP